MCVCIYIYIYIYIFIPRGKSGSLGPFFFSSCAAHTRKKRRASHGSAAKLESILLYICMYIYDIYMIYIYICVYICMYIYDCMNIADA